MHPLVMLLLIFTGPLVSSIILSSALAWFACLGEPERAASEARTKKIQSRIFVFIYWGQVLFMLSAFLIGEMRVSRA
jgi:hypothetical protein